MKAVPFTQTTKAGCASFALANLWNDERYIEGVEKLYFGEWTALLNKKIAQFDKNVYLSTLFCTSSLFTMQANRLVDPLIFEILWNDVPPEAKENQARPLLVTFKRPSAICHCILVILNLKTNLLHVVDSLKEFIEIMTVDDFINSCHIIEVEHFGLWDMDHPEHSMFIYKKQFRHLFDAEE